MAKFDDQDMVLARVYATAVLALAVKQGRADTLREELADLAGYLGTAPDFARFLASPTVDAEARTTAIEKLFRGRYSDLFVDALQVLNRNGRLSLIEAIAACYRDADDDRRNRAEVLVRSATALSGPARTKLRELLMRRTGREVTLVEKVEESLVGGVVVQVGDEKLDMSVSRQLAVLAERLLDRASREIQAGHQYVEGAA